MALPTGCVHYCRPNRTSEGRKARKFSLKKIKQVAGYVARQGIPLYNDNQGALGNYNAERAAFIAATQRFIAMTDEDERLGEKILAQIKEEYDLKIRKLEDVSLKSIKDSIDNVSEILGLILMFLPQTKMAKMAESILEKWDILSFIISLFLDSDDENIGINIEMYNDLLRLLGCDEFLLTKGKKTPLDEFGNPTVGG